MKKIASFTVDHLRLEKGLYVSRIDEKAGMKVTTFDLRMRTPNKEPVIDVPALHTLEHLGATFLRNSDAQDEVIYVGPMGCRTGFYLVMFDELDSAAVYPLVKAMLEFIISYQGEIPGARMAECGNYSEQNLAMAKYYARIYYDELTKEKRFTYPK